MPHPVLQALILADHVYQDRDTGKKVIAGTFNVLRFSRPSPQAAETSPTVPRPLRPAEVMKAGSPMVYLSLTDVRGTMSLDLRYVDLADNEVLMRGKFQVQSEDPLRTVEAVVAVPPLPIRHPGAYALELLYEDELLGALRITAVEMPDA